MTTSEKLGCNTIVTHYGEEHQRNILIEECGELIQAAAKLNREVKTDTERRSQRAHFVEELADVTIMIEQMKYALTAQERYLYNNMKAEKIERQLKRIAEERG